jgi:hypothetical protein
MKKSVLLIFVMLILLGVFSFIGIKSLTIQAPQPEGCVMETETIINISEGTAYDVVFSDNHGDHYYINRGLERGLNLDSLNAKVLNKRVTLHLPKLWLGTSEHIAQLAVGDDIIFTEFN